MNILAWTKIALTLACVICATTIVQAQQSEDTLRIALRQPIEQLDYYYHEAREEQLTLEHIYDTLLYRDPKTFEFKPLLAETWRMLDDTSIEMTLRKDVVFHNGEKFDARSVKFTLEKFSDPAAQTSFPSYIEWIAGVDIIDDYTVVIKTKGPFPAALEYLAKSIPIYPIDYYTSVGREGQATAPVGTGPYKVAEFRPGESLLFERNENYFSDVRGKPLISKVQIKFVTDDSTQIAELLSGRVDWIWYVPSDQLDKLGQVDGIEIARAETMRIAYLGIDAVGRTGVPALDDLRVRQAIAHSIDRENIRAQLVGGDTRVIDEVCFPTQVGCTSEGVVTYNYDLDAARALMAEAGYPDGFDLKMTGYRFRDWSEAIINDLSKIGIRVELSQLPYAAAVSMVHENKASLFFMDWGSGSINDVSAILPHHFTGGPDDFLQNEHVADLIREADITMDPEKRVSLYQEALVQISKDLPWLPMFTMSTNYAYASNVHFDPPKDELPRFWLFSWQQ